MTTSQTQFLSEIVDGTTTISEGKLAYFRTRFASRVHALVMEEFVRARDAQGVNKAKLAKRIGRKPEQITRWLNQPNNWTLETISDLMLALGCEPRIGLINLSEVSRDSGVEAVVVKDTESPTAGYVEHATELDVKVVLFPRKVQSIYGNRYESDLETMGGYEAVGD